MPRPDSSLRAGTMSWAPNTDQRSRVVGGWGKQVTMASATKNICLSLVELTHPIPGWAPAAIHSSLLGKVSVHANRVARRNLSLRQSGQFQPLRTQQNTYVPRSSSITSTWNPSPTSASLSPTDLPQVHHSITADSVCAIPAPYTMASRLVSILPSPTPPSRPCLCLQRSPLAGTANERQWGHSHSPCGGFKICSEFLNVPPLKESIPLCLSVNWNS